jgi:spermidine synthase
VDPAKIDVDAIQARLDDPGHQRIAQSLREVGFGDVVQLLSTYAGQEPDLRPWLEGADVNRDSNLRLQYVAGWALNVSKEQQIYSDMLQYRHFPSNMLVGSPERLRALQMAIGATGSR